MRTEQMSSGQKAGRQQQWERRMELELQRGTGKEVLCPFTVFLLPSMTSVLLCNSDISNSSGPVQISPHSGNLATTQVRNEIFFSRLF